MILLLTVEGDRINRCEIFDKEDLEGALDRFDELQPHLPRRENTATRVCERFSAHLAAGDWDAIAESFVDNFSLDDRRRVVGAGLRHGRDAEITDLRTLADLGWTGMTSTVLATRGERVCLVRARMSFSDREQCSEAYLAELVGLVEIDADERIVALVSFDLDDIDAAIAELDARYLAEEAAAHAHTWSAIAKAYSAVNRHELPPTTPDWVNVDHRRGIAFPPGGLGAYLRATWDLFTPSAYVETVHRLSNLGAVVTRVVKGRSQNGFDAEWREIGMSMVEGGLINRSEIFDETDLHTALARFEELQPRVPRLENSASQAVERLQAHFAARDWAAIAEMLADDICTDDRRRVVNAGIRHGREAEMAGLRATASVGTRFITPTFLATRGRRLVLAKFRFSPQDLRPEAFHSEALGIAEIDADNRIAAIVMFGLDDIDAAYAELDTRYLAGEAAAHARTWSVIAGTHVSFNRGELPTADWVMIDHRRATPFTFSSPIPSIRAKWDLTPDLTIQIEAVHRLSDVGAVVIHTQRGTSLEGFDAEWRMIQLLTVEGDRVNRCELFDEADLDAALARFEELP